MAQRNVGFSSIGQVSGEGNGNPPSRFSCLGESSGQKAWKKLTWSVRVTQVRWAAAANNYHSLIVE